MGEVRSYFALIVGTVFCIYAFSKNLVLGIIAGVSVLGYATIYYTYLRKREAVTKIGSFEQNYKEELITDMGKLSYQKIISKYNIHGREEIFRFNTLITVLALQQIIEKNMSLPYVFSTTKQRKKLADICNSFQRVNIIYYNNQIEYFENNDIKQGVIAIIENVLVINQADKILGKLIGKIAVNVVLGLLSTDYTKAVDCFDAVAGDKAYSSVDIGRIYKDTKRKKVYIGAISGITEINTVHKDTWNEVHIFDKKGGEVILIDYSNELVLMLIMACIFCYNKNIDIKKTVNEL